MFAKLKIFCLIIQKRHVFQFCLSKSKKKCITLVLQCVRLSKQDYVYLYSSKLNTPLFPYQLTPSKDDNSNILFVIINPNYSLSEDKKEIITIKIC